MTNADDLRRRAERYRRMKTLTTDPTADRALGDLVGELEMTAEQIERQLMSGATAN
jgi:hypothetical protein